MDIKIIEGNNQLAKVCYNVNPFSEGQKITFGKTNFKVIEVNHFMLNGDFNRLTDLGDITYIEDFSSEIEIQVFRLN